MNSSKLCGFSSRNAMTLIEILVVTAILGLLCACLFPAFKVARNQARGVVCLNNFRQIGLSLLQYRTDNDDTLCPPSVWLISRWPNTIDKKYMGKNPVAWNTVKSLVWACPENNMKGYKLLAGGGELDGALSRYVFNNAIITLRGSDILKQNQVVMLVELSDAVLGSTPSLSVSYSSFGYSLCSFFGHHSGSYALFVDGHLEFFTSTHPLASSTPAVAYPYWYP